MGVNMKIAIVGYSGSGKSAFVKEVHMLCQVYSWLKMMKI